MKALITGASSGIGKDMAIILSEKYSELVLVGRNKERLEEVKKEINKKSKCNIKIVVMDLSKEENCIKLHKENKDVDLLINNAGFGDAGEFVSTDLKKELLMINTNIVALHILTKLYLKDMVKNNRGHILNVASIAGFLPGPLMATYYSTKSYVVRLSQSLWRELKQSKSKVKISILCPGPVDTGFKETANATYKFKGTNSYKVAKYALDHLNRFYIVPGIGTKLSRVVSPIIPFKLMTKIIYRIKTPKL